MQIDRTQLDELNGILEDVASHFCEENMVSGETFWTCVECFATAKIAELKEHLSKNIKSIQDPATKVKVEEIAKHLVELDKTTKVNDDHLVDLMQYYELVQEIKKSNGVQI